MRTSAKIFILTITILIIGAISLSAAESMFIDTNGNVGIGTNTPSTKLEVYGNIKVQTAAGATATPDYIWLGNSYSNGTTRDKCKIYLYNNGTEQYGFGIGSSSDIQYHSNGAHDFYIGNSNKVRINSTGVGIGTNAPTEKLDVNGNIKFNNVLSTPGRMHINGGELCYILNKNGVIISQAWGGNGNLTVDGNVGVGTATPLQKLDVNGNIRVAAGCIISGTRPNFFLALQGDRNLVLYDNGGAVWNSGTQLSDIRVKKDIKPVGTVLNKVDKLDVISFKYKEGVYDNKTHIGLIAQEVEKYFPDFVYNDAKSGRKLVYYDKLTSVLIQAVKELNSKNAELEKRIKALE